MRSLNHIVAVSFVMLVATLAWSQQPVRRSGRVALGETGLHIVVLEGEDGVNIIKKKTAVKSVVEVRDRNDLPVGGALVVFLLPHGGPSAAFVNGAKQLTVTTGADGRAQIAGLVPSGKGPFTIQIQATFQGQTVTTSISQTNFLTATAAQAAGKVPGSSTVGTSSSATASSAAPGAAGSAAVGGAASGGLSGLAVGGIVAGGVAAIGGGLLASGVIGKSSSATSCTSLVNQAVSDLNTEENICASPSSSFSQCKSAAQTALNDLGKACSCEGATSIPSGLQSFAQQLEQLANQLGLTLPSACGY